MDRRDFLLTGGVALGFLGAGYGLTQIEREPDPFYGYVGQAAPDLPFQRMLDTLVLVEHPRADLILFADFDITALVLSAKTYDDALAPVAPLDLALAWGAASDPQSVRKIDYWQNDRWYVYRSRHAIPDAVRQSSSNMHIVPANANLAKAVGRMRRGNLVRLTGQLCDIHFPNRPEIRSSRTRADRDGGACEIVYVRAAEILS